MERTHRFITQSRALVRAIQALETIEPSAWFEGAIFGPLCAAYQLPPARELGEALGMRHLGSNVVKYLREHLDEAMASTGAPDEQDGPSWEIGTEGVATAEAWTEYPPGRRWVFRLLPMRRPRVIGGNLPPWTKPSRLLALARARTASSPRVALWSVPSRR